MRDNPDSVSILVGLILGCIILLVFVPVLWVPLFGLVIFITDEPVKATIVGVICAGWIWWAKRNPPKSKT